MHMPFFYPGYFQYLLFLAPALLLAAIAQMWVSSAYARASQIQASMSGYAAARRILDAAGLTNVQIEAIPGHLSDHYDPREKVLRLSADNYHGTSLAAVGIAAHESGHAVQDAVGYLPVEFNASSRAKTLLISEGIVNQYDMGPVNNVLAAAALTYVAATLQSILQLLYYIMEYGNRRER